MSFPNDFLAVIIRRQHFSVAIICLEATFCLDVWKTFGWDAYLVVRDGFTVHWPSGSSHIFIGILGFFLLFLQAFGVYSSPLKEWNLASFHSKSYRCGSESMSIPSTNVTFLQEIALLYLRAASWARYGSPIWYSECSTIGTSYRAHGGHGRVTIFGISAAVGAGSFPFSELQNGIASTCLEGTMERALAKDTVSVLMCLPYLQSMAG